MKNQLKKSIIALFAIMTCFNLYSQSYCDSNPVDIHGKLSVLGNKIVDQNNAAVSFAGNSMFWSNTTWGAEKFYNADLVSWLKDDWGTTIVRAAMGVEDYGGYITNPTDNKERVKTIVDAAIAEGLYVIIDWHSHNAENYEQNAIDFFKEMATLYGDYPNVIYEVYNEPVYSSWSNDVKPYAEAVISEIRAIDPDNLVIVGSPTWSQDVDVASNDPITSSINIAYALHFYAGTHFSSLRAKAQTALDNGVALMVTEWGTVSASGDGAVNESSTDKWMDFLLENDISHLNWSVNDKSEGASIVNPGASEYGNWSDSDLTSSGAKVKNIIATWAEYCDGEPITDYTEPVVVPITPEVIEYVLIPSRIEAEDYTSDSGTQLEDTEDVDGVENVGYIDTNDYLSYAIDAENSGDYVIDFRVASNTTKISFNIFSGDTLIGSVSSEPTGGWQIWKTVSTTVSLSAGEQILKLVATEEGWNVNWLEFTVGSNEEVDEEEVIEEEEVVEYVLIPSRIEAEDYTSDSGTQLEDTEDVDGVENVGYIDTNDYLSYAIDAENSGDYVIDFRVASNTTKISFNIFSGDTLIGSVSSEPTGGWQIWKTVSTTVSLSAGEQILKLVATEEGWNVNWLEFTVGSNEEEVEEEVIEEEEEIDGSSNCGDIQIWNEDTVYSNADTQVVYNGIIYENKWYTQNQNPEAFSANSWSLWTVIGECESTAAKSLSNVVGITAFPNPFVNVITVSNETNQIIDSLQLIDLSGKVIAIENGAIMDNLEGVANGLYLLQMLNSKGQIIAVEKIIKQ